MTTALTRIRILIAAATIGLFGAASAPAFSDDPFMQIHMDNQKTNSAVAAYWLSQSTLAQAHAAVGLKSVPALCGPATEVLGTLGARMPNPKEIGRGGDSQGAPIATLFTGNGYWALVAMMSPDNVCVVASGHNWTVTETEPTKAF